MVWLEISNIYNELSNAVQSKWNFKWFFKPIFQLNRDPAGKYSTRSKRGETVISFGTEMSPIADWKRREEDSNVVSVSTNVGTTEKPLQTPYRDDFLFILLA